MSEDEIIAHYFAPLATYSGAWGLKDDAAVLNVPQGYELVITTDTLIEDVHFYADDPPKTIAQKALRVNLSDLAAKGATPYVYTLNLGIPNNLKEGWLEAFAQGLHEDGKTYNISLIGGDTVKSPAVMITITAFGLIEENKSVRRTGAKTGDLILVSGTIGDSALGLTQKEGYYRQRYLLPHPRLELCDYVKKYAHSSMDISDGLLGDLHKLLIASNKGGEINLDKIPLHKPLTGEAFETALTGGDDYEILLTVSKAHFVPHSLLTIIGEVKEEKGLKLLQSGQEVEFQHTSYRHF